jgi:glucosylceramidase
MKKSFNPSCFLVFTTAHKQLLKKQSKMITVYTTAENTDFKLTQTASINFVAAGQPLETQISVLLILLRPSNSL